jgi:hypothetical protein
MPRKSIVMAAGAYGRRWGFCNAAIDGGEVTSWVIRDRVGQCHVAMYFRNAPETGRDHGLARQCAE